MGRQETVRGHRRTYIRMTEITESLTGAVMRQNTIYKEAVRSHQKLTESCQMAGRRHRGLTECLSKVSKG